MIILRQKTYGLKSTVTGIFEPTKWNSEEAAKYAYTNRWDYEQNKDKFLDKGISPRDAVKMKKDVQMMAKSGKSKEEIEDYLERFVSERGGSKKNGLTRAWISGLIDKVSRNRVDWELKEKYDDEVRDTERTRSLVSFIPDTPGITDKLGRSLDKREFRLQRRYKQLYQ